MRVGLVLNDGLVLAVPAWPVYVYLLLLERLHIIGLRFVRHDNTWSPRARAARQGSEWRATLLSDDLLPKVGWLECERTSDVLSQLLSLCRAGICSARCAPRTC